MKKKLAAILSLLTIAMILLTGFVKMPKAEAEVTESEVYSENGYSYIVLKDGTAEIVGYDGSLTDEIIIPDTLGGKNVTSIGDGAFKKRIKVTIIIPDSVVSLKGNPFHNEDGENVHQPFVQVSDSHPTLKVVDGVLFDTKENRLVSYPSRLKGSQYDIPEGTKIIGDYAFGDAEIESLYIPDSVTTIGNFAFAKCDLDSIFIPDGVTNIGNNPFLSFDDTDCIQFTASHPTLTVKDGVLFDKNEKRLIWHPKELDNTTYTVPEGTKIIGGGAFENCYPSLENLILPDSIINIGDRAFRRCNFSTIIIPEKVETIGNCAFAYCSKLESVTIPDSVTYLGAGAFDNCESLTSVAINGNVKSIEERAFAYCYNLETVNIPDGVTSIGNSAFYFCNSLKSITIPDSVTSIGRGAFSGCESLESITIPDSVTSIGDYAFQSCESLESLTIPDSVTSIGDDTFRNCESLESITIPDSVTSIGDEAFSWCSSLESLTIPKSVTSIGNGAFSYCSDLTLSVHPGSYAEQYAIENELSYQVIQ